jgi:anti-sigma factor RsiW
MSARATITCQEIVELMTEYVEGALSAADRHLFERHLVQCPPCRDYLQQLRATVVRAGSLAITETAPELPASTEAALLSAFRNFQRKPSEGEA